MIISFLEGEFATLKVFENGSIHGGKQWKWDCKNRRNKVWGKLAGNGCEIPLSIMEELVDRKGEFILLKWAMEETSKRLVSGPAIIPYIN